MFAFRKQLRLWRAATAFQGVVPEDAPLVISGSSSEGSSFELSCAAFAAFNATELQAMKSRRRFFETCSNRCVRAHALRFLLQAHNDRKAKKLVGFIFHFVFLLCARSFQV